MIKRECLGKNSRRNGLEVQCIYSIINHSIYTLIVYTLWIGRSATVASGKHRKILSQVPKGSQKSIQIKVFSYKLWTANKIESPNQILMRKWFYASCKWGSWDRDWVIEHFYYNIAHKDYIFIQGENRSSTIVNAVICESISLLVGRPTVSWGWKNTIASSEAIWSKLLSIIEFWLRILCERQFFPLGMIFLYSWISRGVNGSGKMQ